MSLVGHDDRLPTSLSGHRTIQTVREHRPTTERANTPKSPITKDADTEEGGELNERDVASTYAGASKMGAAIPGEPARTASPSYKTQTGSIVDKDKYMIRVSLVRPSFFPRQRQSDVR